MTSTLALVSFATVYFGQLSTLYVLRLQSAIVKSNATTVKETVKDANVTARLEEYMIAWRMFKANPWLGQGLGVKHTMLMDNGYSDANGPVILEKRVAYIHNWLLYSLMVGGILGTICTVAILFGPALVVMHRGFSVDQRIMVISTIALLGSYSLFFVVFRLLTFNVLLATIWAFVGQGYISAILKGFNLPNESNPPRPLAA